MGPDVAAKPTAKVSRNAEAATPAQKSVATPKRTQQQSTTTPAPRNGAHERVDGKTAEEWKTVGNDAVKKADHAAAYEAYSQGLRADPDHAMILSNRALCLEKLGRLEEAVTDARRCTVLRPDFVKGFLRAAAVLKELKRPQEALEILRKAPTNPEVEQLINKIKPEAEKAEKARLSTLDSAERFKEEGNVLFKKGFFEKALKVYEMALKNCKDKKGDTAIAIHNNMAGCFQQLSDFHAVVRETNFVLEQQPDNLKALMRRMIALEPLEKYEQALEDARHVIKFAPGNEAANKVQHRLSKVVRDREKDAQAAGA